MTVATWIIKCRDYIFTTLLELLRWLVPHIPTALMHLRSSISGEIYVNYLIEMEWKALAEHSEACVFIYYMKRLAQLTILLLFSLFTRWSLTLCWSSWPLLQWVAMGKMCGRNLWKRPKPTWWKSQSVSQCYDCNLFLQKKQRSQTIRVLLEVITKTNNDKRFKPVSVFCNTFKDYRANLTTYCILKPNEEKRN